MPSTHLSLHYHIVFGTKHHEPIIQARWRRRLHAHLGGIVKTLGGVPESIGGVADHVHLLVGLRATHTLADVLRDTKSVSSSASQLKEVRTYIENQEEHHRTVTFREEYIGFLEATE